MDFKDKVPVQPIADDADDLSHGQRGQHGAYAYALHLAQEEIGHPGGDHKADGVEGDLDLRVAQPRYLRELPREEVSGDYRQPAVVGEGDAEAYQQIADHKIHHAPAQLGGQHVYPELVHVQQLAEHKADGKAEQIRQHEPPPQYHQRQHQRRLEQIGPGAQGKERQHLGKGVGHAGDRGDPRPRVQHQHHAEGVYHHRNGQRQLAAEGLSRYLFVFHRSASMSLDDLVHYCRPPRTICKIHNFHRTIDLVYPFPVNGQKQPAAVVTTPAAGWYEWRYRTF